MAKNIGTGVFTVASVAIPGTLMVRAMIAGRYLAATIAAADLVANTLAEIANSAKFKNFIIGRYGTTNGTTFISVTQAISILTGNVNAPVTTIKAANFAEEITKTTKTLSEVDLKTFVNISDDLASKAKTLIDKGDFTAEQLAEIKKTVTFVREDLARSGKTVGIGDRIADGGKWNDDLLKNQFLTKFGKSLPENWDKFSPQNNLEFAEKLKTFRGNDDLTFDPSLRGGEGQLFDSPLSDNLVLKRWFGARVEDMPESVRLLKEAESLIKANPELSKLIDVVSVGEKGSDWVVRGFDARSVPLKNMISNPVVAKARQESIDILSTQSDEISTNILKKLNKNSANVHWSDVSKKILIIDMQ